MNCINLYLIGTGLLNTALFNYNMIGVHVIRDNKKTRLLPSERLFYSFFAFSYGFLKLPIYIDYTYLKLLNENPENYKFIQFPKKEIDSSSIFKHL